MHFEHKSRRSHRNSRRSGSVIIYTAASIIAFLGVAALSVDMGFLYTRRAEAQKAADAAALAGASTIFTGTPDTRTPSVKLDDARAKAREYAALNNYDIARGANVEGSYPGTPVADADNIYFRVKLGRPESVFFSRIFTRAATRPVEAAAIARAHITRVANAGMPVGGSGNYGVANGTVNLSLFGPDGFYEHGDPYSTRYLNTIAEVGPLRANPRFKEGQGVTFDLNFAADYTTRFGNEAQIEIFDPGTFNSGGVYSAEYGLRIDEMRGGWSTNPLTTTKYVLQSYPFNPNDPSSRAGMREDGSKTYGNGEDVDMRWAQDAAFKFAYDPTRRYQMKIVTLDGTSENGFDLRVGPPNDLGGDPARDAEWSSKYGNAASIASEGHMPINFTRRERIRLSLGYVPKTAANGSVSINKFDNDVGGTDIQYFAEGWRDNIPGTLSGNGEWTTDKVPLPADYPGANWYAEYTASAQDTSAWELTYEAPQAPNGVPSVALVQ